MTRRTHPCRCCRSAVAVVLCESCGAERARHDALVLGVVTRLFGTLGRERFQTAMRAERLAARRTRAKAKTTSQTSLPV